ncbi:unnamed protein product [Rotaria sp. Silwood2]|nr:unnamed protein product [Rotaria sp. Silwood2]CAF4319478.1 unnamed protein product [Rotaria sp. Silwood2]
MAMLQGLILLILFLLTIFTEVIGETKDKRQVRPLVTCLSDEAMKEYYERNPNALKEHQQFEISTKQFISTAQTFEPYVIPVVFHVYGTDFSGKQVNEDIIRTALDKVNEDFHGLNSDYSTVDPAFLGIRSTFDVTFKLARKDPNGNPTNGIVEYPAKNGYATRGHNREIQAEAWDNYKYCNVYIQADIHQTGVLTESGHAYLPDTAMSDNNLARIVYNGAYLYGNTNPEIASILTHEFGHWLNLVHTFDKGCVKSREDKCETTGDQVCDTPQTTQNNDCTPVNNCAGQPVNIENYMDYSGAAGCYKMFTVGQVARMNAAMQHPARQPLWQFDNLIVTGVAEEQLPLK